VLVTNATGYFEAPLLQPGTYRIVVENGELQDDRTRRCVSSRSASGCISDGPSPLSSYMLIGRHATSAEWSGV
jgi:hypothetical protein